MKTPEKHNTELAQQLYGKAASNAATEKSAKHLPSVRRRKVMVALWARLSAIYGAQWLSVYGEVDGPAFNGWSAMLDTITELELAGALKLCETRTGTFPPGFPEFRSMCIAAREASKPNVTEQRRAQEQKTGQSATMIEHLSRIAGSEVAQRELARMHRILAGEEVETFEQAYHNCNLGRRWPGALPHRKAPDAA